MQSLTTVVQSPLFSWVATAFGGLCVVGLFWWRAGSFFCLLDRFWRLVTGRTELHDPILNALLRESLDLEKFQLIYGVKAENISDLHKFSEWKKEKQVGMRSIHKARRWIDVASSEIVLKPPKYFIRGRLGIVFLATLFIVGAEQLTSSKNALLRMRETAVWFKTDAKTVKAPFEGWSFDQVQCTTSRVDVMKLTGFNASEAEAICEAIEQDGLKNLVIKTVKQQAWTGIFFASAALLIALINFYSALGAQEAVSLRKRLNYP
ncbi:MAG: hypothetical protein H6R19_872 [Proteobacteria bacterium]|nr:hypothetical protein [Pseudomonadota bacterium]